VGNVPRRIDLAGQFTGGLPSFLDSYMVHSAYFDFVLDDGTRGIGAEEYGYRMGEIHVTLSLQSSPLRIGHVATNLQHPRLLWSRRDAGDVHNAIGKTDNEQQIVGDECARPNTP